MERTLNDEDNNVSNCRYSINARQGNFSKYQAIYDSDLDPRAEISILSPRIHL